MIDCVTQIQLFKLQDRNKKSRCGSVIGGMHINSTALGFLSAVSPASMFFLAFSVPLG